MEFYRFYPKNGKSRWAIQPRVDLKISDHKNYDKILGRHDRTGRLPNINSNEARRPENGQFAHAPDFHDSEAPGQSRSTIFSGIIILRTPVTNGDGEI